MDGSFHNSMGVLPALYESPRPNYNSMRDSGVYVDRYCSDHLLYPSAPNKHFLYSNRSLTHPPLSKKKHSTYLDHPLPFPIQLSHVLARQGTRLRGFSPRYSRYECQIRQDMGVYLYIKNNTYHLEPSAEPRCQSPTLNSFIE